MKEEIQFKIDRLSIEDQEIQYDNLNLLNSGIITKEQFELLQEEQLKCYREELLHILWITDEYFRFYNKYD